MQPHYCTQRAVECGVIGCVWGGGNEEKLALFHPPVALAISKAACSQQWLAFFFFSFSTY